MAWVPEETRIAEFVTRIDWRSGVREILLRTTDASLKELAKGHMKEILEGETFKEVAGDLLKKVGIEVAGTIASVIGVGCLKSIWKQNDAISKELNLLIREPFQTGSRMANEALDLPYRDEREQAFREALLFEAFLKLEAARTFLKKPNKLSNDRFTIAFLQSQCAYQTRGGNHIAAQRVDESLGLLGSVIKKLGDDAERLKRVSDRY